MALEKIDRLYKKVLSVFHIQKRKLIKQLIIVKIHADWCDKSKTIAPKYSSLKNKFESNAVLFLEFDMTDKNTTQQAKQLANALNLYELVDSKHNTGQILLVDANDRFVLDKLHKNMLFSEMVKSVQKHMN